MRTRIFAAAALVLAACSPDLTGAVCTSDEICPDGQFCGSDGRCHEGTAPASTSASNGSSASGATASGSSGSTASSGSSASSASGSDGSSSSGSTSSASGSSGSSGSNGSGASSGSSGTGSSGSSGSGSSGSTGSLCPADGLHAGDGCALDAGVACAAGDDAILSCAADDAGCGVWQVDEACAGGTVCMPGDTSCHCPDPSLAVGGGCAADAGATCGPGDLLLTCDTSGTCAVWAAQRDCGAASLVCPTGAGDCACAPYDAGLPATFWVDAHDAGVEVAGGPTGAPIPGCAFTRVGDGIAAAADAGGPASVLLSGGHVPAAWQPDVDYAVGDEVTSTPLDQHVFRAVKAGHSGPAQPLWVTTFPGAQTPEGFPDGGLPTWQEAGGYDQEVFDAEAPFAIAPGVALVNAGCTGDATNCDPRAYVLRGVPGAATMVALGQGSTLEGLTVQAVGDGGALVRCTTDAGVLVASVDLDGNGKQAVAGLAIAGGCAAVVQNVQAGGFSGPGADIAVASGVSVTVADSVFGSTVFGQNDAGVTVASGVVLLERSDFSHNASYGVLAGSGGNTAPPLALTVQQVTADHDGIAGILLQGRALADGGGNAMSETLTRVEAAYDGWSNLAITGGILFAGSSHLVSMTNLDAHDNGFAQIDFGSDALPSPNSAGGVWDLTGGASAATTNAVWCYDPITAIGVHTEIVTNTLTGANADVIDAEHVSWEHATPAANTNDVGEPGANALYKAIDFANPAAPNTSSSCPGPSQ